MSWETLPVYFNCQFSLVKNILLHFVKFSPILKVKFWQEQKKLTQKFNFLETFFNKNWNGFNWGMLKLPGLKSSGLYISVSKIGPVEGRKNMFENMFEKVQKQYIFFITSIPIKHISMHMQPCSLHIHITHTCRFQLICSFLFKTNYYLMLDLIHRLQKVPNLLNGKRTPLRTKPPQLDTKIYFIYLYARGFKTGLF